MTTSNTPFSRLGRLSLFSLSLALVALIATVLLPLPAAAEAATPGHLYSDDHSPTITQPRIDMVSYREHLGKAGTFMIVLSPIAEMDSLDCDTDLRIEGAEIYDITNSCDSKTSRGQRVVVLGRYEKPGQAKLLLRAPTSGPDEILETTLHFPEMAKEYPVLERFWAMARIEELEASRSRGLLPTAAAYAAIIDLGATYQLHGLAFQISIGDSVAPISNQASQTRISNQRFN